MLAPLRAILCRRALRFGVLAVSPGIGQAPAVNAMQDDAQGLVADVLVTYDIRADASAVDVTWKVTLDNTGPSSGADAEDGSAGYFPDSASLLLIGPGAGLQATDAGGRALAVDSEARPGGGEAVATAHFGRRLQYGDRFSFTVSYSVPKARNEYYAVGPDYIYLPPYYGIAVDSYRSNNFQLTAPPSLLPNINISSNSCRAGANGDQCDLRK